MKYVIMLFMFFFGWVVGALVESTPSIEIGNTQGTVIGVEKHNNLYKVRVKCDCWHGRCKSSFVIHTPNNYKVGDIIKIE